MVDRDNLAIAFLAGTELIIADVGHVPQTTAGWFAFYFWLCVPWAVLGAIIGFAFGRRRKAAKDL